MRHTPAIALPFLLAAVGDWRAQLARFFACSCHPICASALIIPILLLYAPAALLSLALLTWAAVVPQDADMELTDRYEDSEVDDDEEGEEEEEEEEVEGEGEDEEEEKEGTLSSRCHLTFLARHHEFQANHGVQTAPPQKKRKAEAEPTEPASKKSKKEDDEEDEEEEGGEADAPEDDADEQEQEEDEPAVKTKVIQGSESKTAAAEAETEDLDDEE